ncbi:hypothetical protein MCAG_02282 [Micromonospora sp. ATCC 39149]|nr:hypothetical protein MCAG_02282 [Micromonospora sp. ATCC 39149]
MVRKFGAAGPGTGPTWCDPCHFQCGLWGFPKVPQVVELAFVLEALLLFGFTETGVHCDKSSKCPKFCTSAVI